MAKAKRKKKPEPITIIGPTPEQADKGTFQRLTMAYRRIPVIDTMSQQGKLTARQFNGLARYRDVAIADERSLVEDSVGKMMRGACGGFDGHSPGTIRNAIELGRLEQALGTLLGIARAVAVDDRTVSQWAADKGGTTQDGRPKRIWLDTGMIDIKMAGERLAEAIGA
jgi:hypothetical protein